MWSFPARAVGHAHGKYAQWTNARYGLSGHLWSGRSFSTALDEEHLWCAVRYVETDPVRAGLVERGWDWPWSQWLSRGLDEQALERIRHNTGTGRPCRSEKFVCGFEQKLDQLLHRQKPRPKPRAEEHQTEDLFL